MELKYTENAVTNKTFDSNTANMLLFGQIGKEIDSRFFVDEMNFHNQMGRHVVVKINSVGGKVFDGFTIMEAIEDIGADTYIVGLAASMAGIISQSGVRRLANRRAVLMIHSPKNGSKGLIDITKKTLSKELTDRSALSGDEISAIMDGTKDTFFDADEMFAKGLIDQLIKSGQPLAEQELVNKSTDELYMAFDGLLNLKNNTMKKVLDYLELPESKTEADVINVVKGLQADAGKVENLETEVADLKAEIDTLKDAAKDELQNKAVTLVDGAIKAGKLNEELKDKWVEQAVQNFDLTSETLGAIKVAKTKTLSVVGSLENNGAATEIDYETMERDHPDVMNEMMENEPEKYDALVKAFQKKQRNK